MRIPQSLYLLAFVGVTATLPQHVNAQQWSSEQQEVWDAEVACLKAGINDIPARMSCVHPDFMGWGVTGVLPTGFSEEEANHYFAHNSVKVIEATPLHILVEGDIAVIQLMVMTISSADGAPDEVSRVAWTDIMRRDNGEWRWIADHGHVLGGSN